MTLSMPRLAATLLLALGALAAIASSTPVMAQEAVIRKTLAERLPKLPPIDEVTRTPIPGLWEVRFGGTEILYSDDKGEHILVGGSMIETKTRTDLTEARMEKLLAVDWKELPLKDALVFRQGTGARKIAVFADPNCGYCRRFERDLMAVKDVTIYVFLLPILGPDSLTKSRDIWCARDNARAWRAWMIDGVPAPGAPARCDSGALERNAAFGRKYKITGTPAALFEDGTRKPGAIPGDLIEKLLVAASKKS
jgi:thiol:disulfide interchange protein DsbC